MEDSIKLDMVRATRSRRSGPARNDGEIGKYTMSVTVKLTNVEAHRIRRFESFGLLKPDRTDSRQRLYSDSEIDLIKEIAELENEGINLPGVKMILAIRRGHRS